MFPLIAPIAAALVFVGIAWYVRTHAKSSREAGQTIIVVEQNIQAALTLADRIYIINNGHIVESLTKQAVRAQPEILHRYLGV